MQTSRDIHPRRRQRRERTPDLRVIRGLRPDEQIEMAALRPLEAVIRPGLGAGAAVDVRGRDLAGPDLHGQLDAGGPGAAGHDLRGARAGVLFHVA